MADIQQLLVLAMSARLVENCDICGTTNLKKVLSLGSSPPTCNMIQVGREQPQEVHYPLELLYCQDCIHAMLSVQVDPEEVFPDDYPYSSGNSKALHENFEDLVSSVDFPNDARVVDIGANDGTLLSKFPDDCYKIAVEPTCQADRADEQADFVFREPFTEGTGAALHVEFGEADVITATNVLAHVPGIHGVMRGIDYLLADDGILVVENHDLNSVIKGQWDTVYHEHLRFYSPYSFWRLLNQYGFKVKSLKPIDTHGGSFRVVAERGEEFKARQKTPRWAPVAEGAQRTRRGLRRMLPAGTWGVGATARATTIINYCGLDVEDIQCVAEVQGSDKIGHYIPGTRIPVIDEENLFSAKPKALLLLSWHMSDIIVPKLRERGYVGPIIVPLPYPHYVGAGSLHYSEP